MKNAYLLKPAKAVPLFMALLLTFFCDLKVTAQISTSFSYTGALQTFTVPAGVTIINVDAGGAQGGRMLPVLYLPKGAEYKLR